MSAYLKPSCTHHTTSTAGVSLQGAVVGKIPSGEEYWIKLYGQSKIYVKLLNFLK